MTSANVLGPRDIVNTCGAGDTFCAGLIHSILHPSVRERNGGSGLPNEGSIQFAMKYAEKSLLSQTAVPGSVDLQDMLNDLRYHYR